MENKNTGKFNNFIVQGGILAIAGVLVRILGLAKRIPMPYIIGDIGNSYYSAAYEIYNIVFVISAYGIPLSVSKLVSAKVGKGEYKNAHKIFKVALGVALVIGICTSSVLFLFSNQLAHLLKEPMCYLALRTLAPLLLVVSIMGVFRGYYQGMGTMVPTALSQLIEQIVVIGVGLSGAYILSKQGEKVGLILHNENYKYAYGASGATLGCTVGSFCGLIFLILLYKANQKRFNKRIYRDQTDKIDSTGEVLRLFLLTVVPVIISNFVNYISNIIDMYLHNTFMEKKGLEAIKSINWGIYSGKYLVLINVPIAIATAMGVSSVPAISASIRNKDYEDVKGKIRRVIKITMLIAIPCCAGLIAMAPSLIWFLFSTTTETAPKLLRIGAMGVVLFSFSTLTNSLLQGMGELKKPVIHGIISLCIHISILVCLLNFTDLNIYAVALSNNFFALFICIMNLCSICKILGYRQEILKTFILPTISSVIMGVCIYFTDSFLCTGGFSRPKILISILFGALVYFIFMLITRAITKEDLKMLPGGNKIYSFLKKLKLIR